VIYSITTPTQARLWYDVGENSFMFDTQLEEKSMPKFIIEREIPGVGASTAEAMQAVSQTSCNVLRDMGPQIQWVESYVTDDKIYCVYIAENESLIRDHAVRGGFPANAVSEVKRMIDPTTAEV
jgi:hypothetical protein